MEDATRPRGDDAEELDVLRSQVSEIVGELTHAVLQLFRAKGLPLSEQITLAGGDPLEVLDVFAVSLRALADGLETPSPDWLSE